MEKLGKLLICDCCHREVFLLKLKDTITDGGYNTIHNYTPFPEGWSHSFDLKMDLCPNCSKQFEIAKRDILGRALDQSAYSIQAP